MSELARNGECDRSESATAFRADGMVLQFADGAIAACNAVAAEILGYTADQLIGKALFDSPRQFVHRDGSTVLPEENPALVVLRTGQPRSNATVGFYRSDGGLVWLRLDAQPLFRTNESAPYAVVTTIAEVIFVENISDRKQAEQSLRESEERLRLGMQVAGFAIAKIDYALNAVELSPEAAALYGLPIDELLVPRSRIHATFHPEEREEMAQIIEQVLDPSGPGWFSRDHRVVWENGEVRWLTVRKQVFFDRAGEMPRPTHAILVAIDISDRQQAEQAQIESQSRFRTLADNIAQLAWMADSNGWIFWYNQRWFDYTGTTLEEMQGWGWQKVHHPDHIERVVEHWSHSLKIGQPWEDTFPLLGKDGNYRWFLSRAIPIRDEQGNVVRWFGTNTDISDRQQAELERERLLARQRHYNQQLQGLTAAALAINSALSVEEVLQAITDRAAAIVGTHQSVTSLTVNGNWEQAINAVYLSDKYARWRGYDAKPDGSGIYACVCHLNRPMRMTQAELEAHPHWRGFGKHAENHPPMRGWLAAPLVGRDGHIGLIQLSDKYEGEFTETDEAVVVQLAQMASIAVENARLYEAEQQAREEAQTANRLKDEFLAVLSHELRSPLNPILGWTKLLQTRKLNHERTAEALATIERNAKLQAQLIEDLLDISRIMQGKLTLNSAFVSLSFVIYSALETVRLAAEAKHIQFNLALDPTVGEVLGDAARLQQVVWNLLSNAVKFTPVGGKVTIRLTQFKADAQIQIIDTGKGINPEFLPYVFEYFRQEDGSTTRKFGGLGLGLAIARQIVEMHGGRIWADSPGVGLGATFSFTLPTINSTVKPAANVAIAPSSPSAANTPLAAMRILVVDDTADTRELLTFLLEDNGAIVFAAASAFEALQIFGEFQPDIILSDIGMPQMDGYELMRSLRKLEAGKSIPAIALTAYAGEIDRQQAIAAGFQRHLAKPIEPEQVITYIVELVMANG